jgi:hypothetical protein
METFLCSKSQVSAQLLFPHRHLNTHTHLRAQALQEEVSRSKAEAAAAVARTEDFLAEKAAVAYARTAEAMREDAAATRAALDALKLSVQTKATRAELVKMVCATRGKVHTISFKTFCVGRVL